MAQRDSSTRYGNLVLAYGPDTIPSSDDLTDLHEEVTIGPWPHALMGDGKKDISLERMSDKVTDLRRGNKERTLVNLVAHGSRRPPFNTHVMSFQDGGQEPETREVIKTITDLMAPLASKPNDEPLDVALQSCYSGQALQERVQDLLPEGSFLLTSCGPTSKSNSFEGSNNFDHIRSFLELHRRRDTDWNQVMTELTAKPSPRGIYRYISPTHRELAEAMDASKRQSEAADAATQTTKPRTVNLFALYLYRAALKSFIPFHHSQWDEYPCIAMSKHPYADPKTLMSSFMEHGISETQREKIHQYCADFLTPVRIDAELSSLEAEREKATAMDVLSADLQSAGIFYSFVGSLPAQDGSD